MSDSLLPARKVKDDEGKVHVLLPPELHPLLTICSARLFTWQPTDEAVSCESCARIILLCRHVQIVPSISRSIL